MYLHHHLPRLQELEKAVEWRQGTGRCKRGRKACREGWEGQNVIVGGVMRTEEGEEGMTAIRVRQRFDKINVVK